MSITEILQSAEYVVDPNGKKKAVVVAWEIWEELLTLFEDLEDAEEIKQLREAQQEYVPWDKAKQEL
ncbi:MAG: hypothetical protein AB1817_18130 [Chloroflexota bacterium]